MDGTVEIGVSLNTGGFEAALSRLRTSAAQSVQSALQPIVRSLGSIGSSFSGSASTIQSWASRSTAAFSKVVSGAKTMTSGLIAAGRQAGQAYLSGISQTNGAAAGKALAQKILSGIRQTNGAAAGKTLAQQVINAIAGANYYNAGARIGSSIASGISGSGRAVTAAASNLSGKVYDAFSGGWYSVGYNIAAGIANGVWGGSYLINYAARSVAWIALAEAKATLGIRSPSRVFREEVGQMIPAGIAEGVTAGQTQVSRTVAEQSRAIVREARLQVTPAMSQMAGGQTAPVVTGSSRLQVTVETPLYLDSREVARATSREMSRQMLWEAM